MDMEFNKNLGIKDAMTYNVIKSTSDVSIPSIAMMMTENSISSVVIEDDMNKGIVTANSIISKVVSRDIPPGSITADMVMDDFVAINPEASLFDASKKMIENNCKVLVVVSDDVIKGIITLTDIVRVSPELIQVFSEKQDIDDGYYDNNYDNELNDGVCEHCGVYDNLSEYDGQYMCSECIDELKDNDDD